MLFASTMEENSWGCIFMMINIKEMLGASIVVLLTNPAGGLLCHRRETAGRFFMQ